MHPYKIVNLKAICKMGVCLFVSVNLISTAAAQSAALVFPSKPVRIIVPQTPGGASDALARIVGQKLSEKWGQSVVVENRPGAGGNIGMDAVAKAPGDGYTLLMSYVGSHAINPSIYSKLPFDPEADFVAVATLAYVPFVAAVNSAVPVTNMKSLAAYAAQKPVAFGSAGNGSVNHLLGEMFNTASGAKMQHVPYKGAAPALTDLISGQIQVVFTSLPSVAQHIRGGTVKGLSVTGSKRAAAFKDIPTIAESGFPGFVINPWFGLFASKGTPATVAKQINADVKKVMEDKDLLDKFAALGAEPFETTPQEFQSMLHADIKTWAAVVKSSGATAD
jgi:tripartite-type tricarboxylate transporter receptor subunit TctC